MRFDREDGHESYRRPRMSAERAAFEERMRNWAQEKEEAQYSKVLNCMKCILCMLRLHWDLAQVLRYRGCFWWLLVRYLKITASSSLPCERSWLYATIYTPNAIICYPTRYTIQRAMPCNAMPCYAMQSSCCLLSAVCTL